MKNIFNPSHSDEILNRIDKLNPYLKPQWGKMDVAQMLAHCSSFQDIPMGNVVPARDRIGRLIGKFVKPIFYNDKPLPKNLPTIPTMFIVDEKEFETEKIHLKHKMIAFQSYDPEKCQSYPHPFFGKLTTEQWGKGIYKHLDHHLKQFGV